MENTIHQGEEIPEQLKETINQFKKTVFSGKIGKLHNHKVKLKINKQVPLIAQRERRLPFVMRGKVKSELQKLENAGIIETVTTSQHPGSALWSLYPKATDKSAPVDIRGPNTAIECTRYQLSMIYDTN